MFSLKKLLLTGWVAAWASSGSWGAEPMTLPMASGPFKPDLNSLKQYECPKWFRDAKFGIWAHWGPQSVPMDGDWYARGMYEEGSHHYKDHLERYGHPSLLGYKDIIPLWKAEKWDPDRLMRLYKRAGAKYFVSMGSHHDNFFLWNSKLHRWNAVKMGPHRDVVGDWQKAAKKEGLRFGVSEHLGASFTWFQASHGADKTGPMAGLPYDGADPHYQDLYHFPAEPGDRGWYSTNPCWQQQWYSEIKELVDNYHPDLLYTDGGVPFGNEVGRSMIAHFYNSNAAQHGGKVEAVYTCKESSDGRWVEDLERGIMGGIDPNPWQTDTSIGDWFYNRNWKFRPLKWVVHTLVDNVSKNGNLLLNVVQRPDGSLDPEVEQMLGQMAAWSAVHGEAIYNTRPWKVYGEGTVRARGGSFQEDYSYSARDIRFTTKCGILYALALGWPDDHRIIIRSLARTGKKTLNRIESVKLLGYKGQLKWTQDDKGLIVNLPGTKVSDLTVGLKITGNNLEPVPIPEVARIFTLNAMGNVTLTADTAELHGSKIRVEERVGKPNIGYWDKGEEWPFWKVKFAAPGAFRILADIATPSAGTEFVVEVGSQQIAAQTVDTGGWDRFQQMDLGRIVIEKPGVYEVKVRPRDAGNWKPLNLQGITFKAEPG